MQIFLTYDYELFFGKPTGTVEKCIIEPTNRLREIAAQTKVKFVFFIDVGYLKKLIELKDSNSKVAHEHQLVTQQIETLVDEGHDCQLHIHPHWEDCTHNGEQWTMNTNRYKLVDFSDAEIEKIVLGYQAILANVTKKTVNIYRAGGWCLQPFSRIKKAFEKAGLKLDSSVFLVENSPQEIIITIFLKHRKNQFGILTMTYVSKIAMVNLLSIPFQVINTMLCSFGAFLF